MVVPSNAYDAKGLLIQAIRDDDPVIFCEHKLMYDLRAEVPDEPYTIPFGEANIVRDGDDVTIVALARMVHYANEAAETLAEEGIECELIDPRTTSPLDEDTILESVERTGRLVVVDEATPRCSMATDIAALVADKAFAALKAPVRRVTAPHTPVPFAPSLEKLYIPSPERIAAAVREVARVRAMSAPITAITMPKWGLTMTEGKVVQLAEAARRSALPPGEELLEIETTKITNVVEADAAGTLRRIVAPEGATLPIGALLAVIAPPEMPEAEIDAFVARFRRGRASRSGRRMRQRWRRARCEVARPAPALSRTRRAATACRCCWCTASAAISTPGCSPSRHWPKDGGRSRWICRGMAGRAKDVGAGDADALRPTRSRPPWRARHRAGAPRRAFDGRRDCGARWRRGGRSASRSLTLIASAGLGPEINGRVHRRLRARVAAPRGGRGAAISWSTTRR